MSRPADASACPEDVLGWIPAWPDGGLDDAQRGAVEAHAAACPRCREELALVSGQRRPPADEAATEAALTRVMERVRADRQGTAPRHAAPPRRTPPRPRPALGGRPARLALAAGLALACAAVGALAALSFSGEAPTYRTATRSEAPAAPAAGPVLDVVFRDDVDAGRIRVALRAVNGQIEAGPSELGRYRVRLGAGADARAAARALAAGDAGVAVFAEPAPR